MTNVLSGNDKNGSLTVIENVTGSVGGWYWEKGDAINGDITLTESASVQGNVFGGYTHSGNASENTASIQQGAKVQSRAGEVSTGAVFGGYTDQGNASDNFVTVSGDSSVDLMVVGGQAYSGAADGNQVYVVESSAGRPGRSEEEIAQFPDAVVGGVGDSAKSNSVIMRDGMSHGRVTGGAAWTGEANDNQVTIDGGHVTSVAGAGSVIGGLSNGAAVQGNRVTIENSAEIDHSVIGGYTLSGAAEENTVEITESTVHGTVYGGLTGSGRADGNTVTVKGTFEGMPENLNIEIGDNTTDVGNGTAAIYGGRTENGSAADNMVNVGSVIIEGTPEDGSVVGGYAAGGAAARNTVTFSGDVIAAFQSYGGYAEGGSAIENTVSLGGGTIAYEFVGGYASGGTAERNTVNLKAGGEIYIYDRVLGGYADGGSAIGNKVNIDNGAKVAGYSFVGGRAFGGAADSNEINVSSGAVITDARSIYGGYGDRAAKNSIQIGGSGDDAQRAKIDQVYDIFGGRGTSGDAEENFVGIYNADVYIFANSNVSEGYEDTSYFTGGWTGRQANDNQLVLKGSKIITDAKTGENNILISGGFGGTGASGNMVAVISGSEMKGNYLNGGHTAAGDASENLVIVDESTVTLVEDEQGLLGGRTKDGNASRNEVYVIDGTVTAEKIAGGITYYGAALGNLLYIENNSDINADFIYGGVTKAGDAAGNTITISNSTLKGKEGNDADSLAGGYTEEGNASDNRVEVLGTTHISHAVYGGLTDNGDVLGNELVFDGEDIAVDQHIFGGYTEQGNAVGNSIDIGDNSLVTALQSIIYGGHTKQGNAIRNVINIGNTSQITALAIVGGDTDDGTASDNTVVGKNTTVNINELGGGWATEGLVSGNEIALNGGTAKVGIVYGGGSRYGNAENNAVYISGTEIMKKDGDTEGPKILTGGFSENGNVSANLVEILGEASLKTDIYGGYTESGVAQGNTVFLTGGTLSGDIAGAGVGTSGAAIGNTVFLTGNMDVSHAALYGWKLVSSDNTRASVQGEGNSLVIDDWSGSTLSTKNFDTVRFKGITWNPKGTILTITNGDAGDLDYTAVDAGSVTIRGDRTPQVSESMTFINDKNASSGLSAVQASGGFMKGVATLGTAEWGESSNSTLDYTITGVFRNPQTDIVGHSRLAGAAFVNQGADIAADSLHLLDDGYHFGTQTFGAVYGGRSTYDVASDIKINGWSTIVGAGNVHPVECGRLAWGIFYENGTGNYRTWNEFNNELFRGDGSLLYNGGGAAVRLTKDSGAYYEASFRAGTLSSSMSDAVKDGDGNSYGFDSDSTYWGAHFGAGKLFRRGSGQWDVYGKYFHTEIDGDSFYIGGDSFSFDSLTSDRLRVGARYTREKERAWSLYYGAAWEYEFSGDSHMKAGPWNAPEQSLQGSTVFGEIGTIWHDKNSPWSLDINLRGYTGEREGFSGMVTAAYSF